MKNYMAGPQVVASTNLALTIPRSLATMQDMKILELPFSVASLDQYLYWHKSADLDQANMWMRGHLGLCWIAMALFVNCNVTSGFFGIATGVPLTVIIVAVAVWVLAIASAAISRKQAPRAGG